MNALQDQKISSENTEFHIFDSGMVEIPPSLKEFLTGYIPNPIHKIKILKTIFPDITLRDARNITRGWEN